MATERTCPKCPNSPPMAKSQFLTIVPVTGEARYGTQSTIVSEKAGIVLQAYECLSCHLVEFYHEEVS
jgi:hypothetical protein